MTVPTTPAAAPAEDETECEECGEPPRSYLHDPADRCRGGTPCIAPGAHHPFRPRQTELELRLAWGDR